MEGDGPSPQGPEIAAFLLAENIPLEAVESPNEPLCTTKDFFTAQVSASDGASSPESDFAVYFEDGLRRVDFVLVSHIRETSSKGEVQSQAQMVFEENLILEGLELEYAFQEVANLRYVKIHAPWEVLSRYAEILQFKLPMKEITFVQNQDVSSLHDCDVTSQTKLSDFDISKLYRDNLVTRQLSHISSSVKGMFKADASIFPNKDKRLTTVFSKDKEYMFDIPRRKVDFFSPAQRSQIIDFILKRKRYSHDRKNLFGFGIKNLLADGTYLAAFPLHEGRLEQQLPGNLRWYLKDQWASLTCIHKKQPLDLIKHYFGVRIGLYFSWLGYYTFFLIFASIVGLICFIYGCLTMSNNIPSHEICTTMGNTTMCPLCIHQCRYWKLRESCSAATITHLFDNPATIFFSGFMAVWGTVFLEFWKRYSSVITHRWDLVGYDTSEEQPRPEYLACLAHSKRKINVVTGMYEPHIPFYTKRLPFTILSISVILLLVLIALAAVFGVIMYRLSIRAALAAFDSDDDKVMRSMTTIIVSSTAAMLNLICILIFNRIYARIATFFTELEMHRTQTEFDNSLTLKMFLLQFVNYYASLFYVAFIKGRFAEHPGAYKMVLGYRQEECGTEGCLMELTIQLAIIMVGKQAFNSLVEMSLPRVKAIYSTWSIRKAATSQNSGEGDSTRRTGLPWEEDYRLAHWEPSDLFYEYLEMVLQFGFVTLFVAAFPLAPLFALLNNTFEIRLDARKLITVFRRPVGQRVRNIGIWYRILDSIGRLAVLSNAVIIAFTSSAIPRIVYEWTHNSTLEGYIDYSLSYFNPADFPEGMEAKPLIDPSTNRAQPLEFCRYEDYRHPPWSDRKYEYTEEYWHVLAARLGFIIAFVTTVSFLKTAARVLIPDMPKSLRDQIRHENFITHELAIETQLRHVKEQMEEKEEQAKNGKSHGWVG